MEPEIPDQGAKATRLMARFNLRPCKDNVCPFTYWTSSVWFLSDSQGPVEMVLSNPQSAGQRLVEFQGWVTIRVLINV